MAVARKITCVGAMLEIIYLFVKAPRRLPDSLYIISSILHKLTEIFE